MNKSESNQQAEGDAARQSRGADEPCEPQEPSQAELAVMHPDGDDPEWRYYFGAWHS